MPSEPARAVSRAMSTLRMVFQSVFMWFEFLMVFYSWYVILSNAKNLAKCLAKSQRGIAFSPFGRRTRFFAVLRMTSSRKGNFQFSILNFQFENHSIASLEMRLRAKSSATAFLSFTSGRNTILCPLICAEGEKSSACMVSAG